MVSAPREEIRRRVDASVDAAVRAGITKEQAAVSVNAASARVGKEGNADTEDLIQIAALVMIMAEHTLLSEVIKPCNRPS